MRKIIPYFVVFVFFSFSNFVSANFTINEIMYDLKEGSDTGREWVEVYNNSENSLDLATFKFFEANTNHALILSQGDTNIPSHGYAIISSDPVKFKIDWPDFVGSIFDSSFSLSNTGESLGIKDMDLNTVDEYVYNTDMGGGADGNSLQKISGSWKGAIPTPGVTNENVSIPATVVAVTSGNSNTDTSTSSVESSSSSEVNTVKVEKYKIQTNIISSKHAFVGVSTVLEANTTGVNKEKITYGKYFWNFGDGEFKEIKSTNFSNLEKVNHKYLYPGEYIVSLEYYQNMYIDSDKPDAVYKTTITIVPTDIVLSKFGDAKDFFIEITNNTKYNFDISNWILKSKNRSFVIPKNTEISSKNKIIFPSRATNFNLEDKNSLELMTAFGEIIFNSANSLENNKTNQDLGASHALLLKEIEVKDIDNVEIETKENVNKINNENTASKDLAASMILSDNINKENKDSKNSTFVFISAFIFISISAILVYFIRKNKVSSDISDDFEITDA
jgi:hypothetical protein